MSKWVGKVIPQGRELCQNEEHMKRGEGCMKNQSITTLKSL